MASDFPSGAVSGLWLVLYDDDYLSDHRRFRIWNFSVPDPPGNSVYSLYPDAAGQVWGKQDLLFPASSRCTDDHNLCIVSAENEENCFGKYETVE